MSTKIPLITKLSTRVIRVLGCNPGPMTLQGTNTYIIGTGKKRILVDTGDSGVKDYTTALLSVLLEEKCTLEGILVTHWHHDHIGGVPQILDLLKQSGAKCSVWKLPRTDSDEEEYDDIRFDYVENGYTISTEGATIKVIATPGHTTDHAAVWLNEESAVFSGDCILGEGTTVFEHLPSYMRSLKLLANLSPKKLYPGHGPVVEKPIEKIEEYLTHRLEREKNILIALSELTHKNQQLGVSEMDIVNAVYKGLADHLKLAAASNVNHHLVKLLEDDKVVQLPDSSWILKESNSKL